MHPSEPYDVYWFFRPDLQLSVVGIVIASQPHRVYTGLQREPFDLFHRSFLLAPFDIVERVGLLNRHCSFCITGGRLRARATKGHDEYGNPLTTEWDGWEWSDGSARPRPELPMCWCMFWQIVGGTACANDCVVKFISKTSSTNATDFQFTEQSGSRIAKGRPRSRQRPLSRDEAAARRQRSQMLSRRPPRAR